MFWHDHKDFQSPWARNVLHQLSLEWRRSQAKERHSELKVRALTAPQDFPKSHFLGLLELQRNVVTSPLAMSNVQPN